MTFVVNENDEIDKKSQIIIYLVISSGCYCNRLSMEEILAIHSVINYPSESIRRLQKYLFRGIVKGCVKLRLLRYERVIFFIKSNKN